MRSLPCDFFWRKPRIPNSSALRLSLGAEKESPSKVADFIIMDYIDHKGNIRDLEIPGSCLIEVCPVLNPDLSMVGLEFLYGKIANIILALSTVSLSQIGSPDLDQDDGLTWEALHRPWSYSMNEIVRLGTVP
jgi:hypothetical protein